MKITLRMNKMKEIKGIIYWKVLTTGAFGHGQEISFNKDIISQYNEKHPKINHYFFVIRSE